MRNITLIVVYLFPLLNCYSQERVENTLDSLNNLKAIKELKSDSLKIIVNNLEKEIQQINKQISQINTKQKFNNKYRVSTNTRGKCLLKSKPFVLGEIIDTIPAGEIVYAYTYVDQYYGIIWGDLSGYISEIYLMQTDELSELANYCKNENEKQKRLKLEERNRQLKFEAIEREKQEQFEQDEYKKKIISKYGSEIGEKLLNGYYWIGMTDEMARISLGEPDDINRSVGSWGVHEQWIYDKLNIYLYFENGELTSYQN